MSGRAIVAVGAAGLTVGDHAVGHVDPGVGPGRDGARGAEVDVVRVRHDHQDPLDALVGRSSGISISLSLSSSSWLSSCGFALRALRRLHDLAEQEPALLLPHLVVAGAVFVDRVGVRGEHRRRRARRARPRRSPGPARAPPRPAAAASARAGTPRARPWPGCGTACRRATRPISSASPSGGSGSTSGDSPVSFRYPRISPVHQFGDVPARRADRHRGLGVLGEPRVVDERRARPGLATPHSVDEPRARRAAGSSRHRGARRRRASRRSARPARGPARGSSGSRSSLPC